jgi:hypothetical protein
MRPHMTLTDRETGKDTSRNEGEPSCPVCEGPLIPLCGFYRCSRCFFSLCLGCEAGEAPIPGATC